MPGYLIANYNINDNDTYQKYAEAVGPILTQYGGKVILYSYSGDRESKILEGNPRQVIIVLEFDSIESAERWYNSLEYQKIKNLRTSSTEGWAVITKEYIPPKLKT